MSRHPFHRRVRRRIRKGERRLIDRAWALARAPGLDEAEAKRRRAYASKINLNLGRRSSGRRPVPFNPLAPFPLRNQDGDALSRKLPNHPFTAHLKAP